MTTPSTETANASLTRDLLYAARYYLGGTRGILILATIAILAGLALNWSWLVATGIAPILLTALPCAVMCGLGLCGKKLFGGSCSTQASQSHETASRTGVPVTPLIRSTTADGAASCCQESNGDRAPGQQQVQPLETPERPS